MLLSVSHRVIGLQFNVLMYFAGDFRHNGPVNAVASCTTYPLSVSKVSPLQRDDVEVSRSSRP